MTKKQELLKYSELLKNHYGTLETLKQEKQDTSLLLKCIKGTQKQIRIKVNKLVEIGGRDQVIGILEKESEIWWAIGESYTISEFKNLVGIEKFNELMKDNWEYAEV